MSAKHTPGPWNFAAGDQVGFKTLSGGESILAASRPSDDFFVLKIAEMDTNVSPAERTSNARLIAAAPELLGVLAEGVGLQARHHGDGTGLHIAMIAWADRARAAIARATGEQG